MDKSLRTLIAEIRSTQRFIQTGMPRAVSRTWKWEAQNAFVTQREPYTGKSWKDRFGLVYGKRFRRSGNVEQYLTYSKLHRTGRLLRGLRSKYAPYGNGSTVTLYNNVPYASDHENGVSGSPHRKIKKPYVQHGADAAILGGNITQRSSMRPSAKVLALPMTLLEQRFRANGWVENG